MKIKVGDKVKVITGENKGKSGKVIAVLKSKDKVIIDGINLVKKHVKPNGQKETGGILETEAPIHISNVKVLTAQEKKEKKTKKEIKEVKKENKK